MAQSPKNSPAFCEAAVINRQNILISGGTGTGKTTLLNILATLIPEHERILIIEDTAEIQISAPNLVRFEARVAQNGFSAVTIRELLKASLRHRPDRILLGEIRGAEAFDLLQLLNTGHSGTISTVHANSALQAINRFTSCVLQSNVELPYRAIKSNIADSLNLLVHIERRPGLRFVSEVLEIAGYNSEYRPLCIRPDFRPCGGIMRRTFRYVLGTVGRWAAVSAALSAILFVAAGTTRLTSLCTYLAAFSVALLVAMLAVIPSSHVSVRIPAGILVQRISAFASGFFFLMTLISASFLVGRAHTLIVPTAMRWIALATFISSSSLQTWAMVANPYFSPVVRIQAERGHKFSIHFGPYRFVRHPGYLAICISVSASAVAIGSWLALIPAGGFIAVVYERAKFEEQFLKANLPGYAQYAKTVPSGMFHSRST